MKWSTMGSSARVVGEMARALARDASFIALWPVRLMAVICLLLVFIPVLPQKASAATQASDDFNRAAGSLGTNWTGIHDGGLSISSHAVTGRSGLAGDIWTAGTFTSDQYSQIEVTSTHLTGDQWIGAAVRVQNGGQDAYAGIYYWNGGHPELQLFSRSKGNWAPLSSYNTRPLAAGTQLRIMAVGSKIVFLENGVQRLSVSDSSLSGGAPGIMIYGAGTAGSWSGGDVAEFAGFQVHYMSTDANGVRSYEVISADNGLAPQVMRVLTPTHPAPGVPQISCTCCQSSLAWAKLSTTGWIRCAGSMRKISTT